MTREQFEMMGFSRRMSYEQYQKCDCSKCELRKECPHEGNMRRLPLCAGGLGMCQNLNEEEKQKC